MSLFVCLLHSRTETLWSVLPIRYSVLLLILLCVCVCVCVCVFTRLSFKLWVLFHTVFGFVLPMDWKSDRRGSESSQAVVGKGYRGDFDFKGSFLKFPLNLSVFACQVFLSSLFFLKKKIEEKKVERGKNRKLANKLRPSCHVACKHLPYLILQRVHFSL